MIAAFASEHELEQAEVCIELVDGSRYTLATASAGARVRVLLLRAPPRGGRRAEEAHRPDRRRPLDRDLGAGPRAAVRLRLRPSRGAACRRPRDAAGSEGGPHSEGNPSRSFASPRRRRTASDARERHATQRERPGDAEPRPRPAIPAAAPATTESMTATTPGARHELLVLTASGDSGGPRLENARRIVVLARHEVRLELGCQFEIRVADAVHALAPSGRSRGSPGRGGRRSRNRGSRRQAGARAQTPRSRRRSPSPGPRARAR